MKKVLSAIIAIFATAGMTAQSHCSTGFPDEYARIEETVSEAFPDDMIKWINCVCSGK